MQARRQSGWGRGGVQVLGCPAAQQGRLVLSGVPGTKFTAAKNTQNKTGKQWGGARSGGGNVITLLLIGG